MTWAVHTLANFLLDLTRWRLKMAFLVCLNGALVCVGQNLWINFSGNKPENLMKNIINQNKAATRTDPAEDSL